MTPLKRNITRFRSMLANCYWWQRIADPNAPWDFATAESHIYRDGLPAANPGPDHTLAQLQSLRPFAIIWHDTAAGFRQSSESVGGCVKNSGSIVLQIEFDVDEALSSSPPAEIADWADDKLGPIFGPTDSEPCIWNLNYQAEYPVIQSADFYGYVRTDPDDRKDLGDVIRAEYLVNWGTQ